MALLEFRDQLLHVHDKSEHIYCGPDIACGLLEQTVKRIVHDCNVQFDFDSFKAIKQFPKQSPHWLKGQECSVITARD